MFLYWTELWLAEGLVRNGYEIHRALWRLFPGQCQRDFLFSIQEKKRGTGAKVLLQSNVLPTISTGDEEKISIARAGKSLSGLKLQAGQFLRFRLVANPTKRIKDQVNPGRSVRVPHIGEEHKIAWLIRKLEKVARVCHAESSNMEPIYFSKPGHRGKIQPVLFTGVIKIENSGAFKSMMEEGIGAAKAFGCGLIQVARL